MTPSTVAVNTGGMAFEIHQDGHTFWLDADESSGGTDKGPRPKALLLSGLAGCTGMDVASILRKMTVPFTQLRIEVEASVTDEHPRVYDSIRLKYILTGENLDQEKIRRAVELSQEKYCAVTAMLAKSSEISYEIQTSS